MSLKSFENVWKLNNRPTTSARCGIVSSQFIIKGQLIAIEEPWAISRFTNDDLFWQRDNDSHLKVAQLHHLMEKMHSQLVIAAIRAIFLEQITFMELTSAQILAFKTFLLNFSSPSLMGNIAINTTNDHIDDSLLYSPVHSPVSFSSSSVYSSTHFSLDKTVDLLHPKLSPLILNEDKEDKEDKETTLEDENSRIFSFFTGDNARLRILEWMAEQGYNYVFNFAQEEIKEEEKQKKQEKKIPDDVWDGMRRFMNEFAKPFTSSCTHSIIGLLFFKKFCHLSHSCTPNASYWFTMSGSVIIVANRAINSGEEITISYDPGLGYFSAKQIIRPFIQSIENYSSNNICKCKRCSSSSSSSSNSCVFTISRSDELFVKVFECTTPPSNNIKEKKLESKSKLKLKLKSKSSNTSSHRSIKPSLQRTDSIAIKLADGAFLRIQLLAEAVAEEQALIFDPCLRFKRVWQIVKEWATHPAAQLAEFFPPSFLLSTSSRKLTNQYWLDIRSSPLVHYYSSLLATLLPHYVMNDNIYLIGSSINSSIEKLSFIKEQKEKEKYYVETEIMAVIAYLLRWSAGPYETIKIGTKTNAWILKDMLCLSTKRSIIVSLTSILSFIFPQVMYGINSLIWKACFSSKEFIKSIFEIPMQLCLTIQNTIKIKEDDLLRLILLSDSELILSDRIEDNRKTQFEFGWIIIDSCL